MLNQAIIDNVIPDPLFLMEREHAKGNEGIQMM
jgi:hypothetical protein